MTELFDAEGRLVGKIGTHSDLRVTFAHLLEGANVRCTSSGWTIDGARFAAWDGAAVDEVLKFAIYKGWLHVTVVSKNDKKAAFVAAPIAGSVVRQHGGQIHSPSFKVWGKQKVRLRGDRPLYTLCNRAAVEGSYSSIMTDEILGLFLGYKVVKPSAFTVNIDI